MDIVWKGVLGGLVTALIVWLSKRGNVLPGILPLAPTFAIIALLAVGAKGDVGGDAGGFKTACLAGLKTIPAYVIFLVGCYFLIDKMDYRFAILGGLAFWLVAALAIFLAPKFI